MKLDAVERAAMTTQIEHLDESFDAVANFGPLHRVPDWRQAVSEAPAFSDPVESACAVKAIVLPNTSRPGFGPCRVGRNWRSRATVLLVVSVALAVSSCATGGSGAVQNPAASPRLVSVEEFAAELNGGERFVLNVHTPDEGSLERTTAAIPFDQLEARADELPPDRSTPLAVYCRSGNMSQTAVLTLAQMGYVDVIELGGGMNAWVVSGRTLVPAEGPS